jgi:porphobilinogen synthase
MTGFPVRRLRRVRRTDSLRALVRETRVAAADLIQPIFVVEDSSAAGPIEALPGVARHALGALEGELDRIVSSGVGAILIFGIPAQKDATGSRAASDDGVVAAAVRRIRTAAPALTVITDVCLCSYTEHGHCGIVVDGDVDNDRTLAQLSAAAVAHARAGAHVVAPSAMMDGQVGSLRAALDAVGQSATAILSYSTKFASAFYGPFREAADSAPQFGNRRSYQLDPATGRQAVAEAEADAAEGADLLMVKPALPYLDIVARVRAAVPSLPLVAYQVSGEYSMVKAAAARGWIDERAAALETLTAIKRAGADAIITYFAVDVANALKGTVDVR